jgi:L-ascorbate metabolism protein UlaG (beta-lactamase superfamily)
MAELGLRATYIGGPTALLEIGGLRLLTDPTFDASGSEYPTPVYTLHKTSSPAIHPASLLPIDAVLLSHDHHFDNLDRGGRAFLASAQVVLTTPAGAERLGGNARGLAPWQSLAVNGSNGSRLRLTSTPARHGPPGGDRGPVTGFLITEAAAPESPESPGIYISGDTVWYEEIPRVAERADIAVAILFMGAARVREVGPAHLTLTADEGVEVARALPHATIVPLHYEGWGHFSQGRREIQRTFAAHHLEERLCWLEAGKSTDVPAGGGSR